LHVTAGRHKVSSVGKILGFGAVVAALVCAAAAQPAAGPRTFGTTGDVRKIAADGASVAVAAAGGGKRCPRVVVFSTAAKRFDSYDLCGSGVAALALAGNQVAWMTSATSANANTERELGGARLGTKAKYDLDSAERGPVFEGGWFAAVRGGGGVLVYSRFNICDTANGPTDCFEQKPTPGFGDYQITDPQLVKVAGRQKRPIRKELDAVMPVAVDSGQIALAPAPGSKDVTIANANGSVASKVTIASPPAVSLTSPDEHVPYALAGGNLYVLRAGGIETYAAKAGTLTKTTPLPGAARAGKLVGVAGGLAAILKGGGVQVVRLTDGKARPVAAPAGAKAPGIVDAWLTGAGLFYAYNVPSTTSHGRVAFVPLPQLG
jgi:hypothetical protein